MIDTLTSAINSVGGLFDALGSVVPKVVAGCSVAAALLPAPDGDGRLSKLHRAMNMVAFNFRYAENK